MPVSSQDKRQHWEAIYRTKPVDSLSWYQSTPRLSLELIESSGMAKHEPIIDVGGGSSTLVDELLSRGYSDISVLDISENSLEYSKSRLGAVAAQVKWLAEDITAVKFPPSRFGLWHDRALFHFLVDEADRERYLSVMSASIRSGGYAIIAAFGPHGPLKCSGLEIVRYTIETLELALGGAYNLVSSRIEDHITPQKATQEFLYCLFRKEQR